MGKNARQQAAENAAKCAKDSPADRWMKGFRQQVKAGREPLFKPNVPKSGK